MPRSLLAACALLLVASANARATDYTQAAGSTLAFAGNYQDEVFTGRFPGFATKMSFDPTQLSAARLAVDIPIADATTANADYDGEMRGASFFDATHFPVAHYTATAFRSLGGGRYAADGTLELHGVRRPVTLTFTWTAGPRPVLEGKASVRRLDFGIGGGDWADTDLIPDAIAISTRVLLVPVAAH